MVYLGVFLVGLVLGTFGLSALRVGGARFSAPLSLPLLPRWGPLCRSAEVSP